MQLPGHYLGAVNTGSDPLNWAREYSLEIRSDGSYALYMKDGDGFVMMAHSGTSGRAFADFTIKNGFDCHEIHADIKDIDSFFAAEYRRVMEERMGT